jgi:ubiquinol-cytochrome c reductase cytochrome b subunit
VRSAVYRPLYRKCFWVFTAVCIGLGYLGAQPAEGVYLYAARVLMAYYFFHFLVLMPWLGKREKCDPVPESIEAAVAVKSTKGAVHA